MTVRPYFIEIYTDSPDVVKPRIVGHIELDITMTAEEIGTKILSILERSEPRDSTDVLKRVSVVLDELSTLVRDISSH